MVMNWADTVTVRQYTPSGNQRRRVILCGMGSLQMRCHRRQFRPTAQRCRKSIGAIGAEQLNSLATGKFERNVRHVIFKQILVIDGGGIFCEIVLMWMSLDFTDDQSTLVQVMAWCRQATSHYLSQCWPRSLSLSGVTRPWWGKVTCTPMQSYIAII